MHNNLELIPGSVLPWVNHCCWLCLHVSVVLKCTDAEAPMPSDPHLCRKMKKMPSSYFKHLWVGHAFMELSKFVIIYNIDMLLFWSGTMIIKCISAGKYLWKNQRCQSRKQEYEELNEWDVKCVKLLVIADPLSQSLLSYQQSSSPVSHFSFFPALLDRYVAPRAVSVPVFSLHSLCVFLSVRKVGVNRLPALMHLIIRRGPS